VSVELNVINTNWREVTILGSKWSVIFATSKEDPFLETRDGYCDKTSRRIVICDKEPDCELDRFFVHQNKVLRHEIIHAFLFESGLAECFEHQPGHDETYLDWFAIQFPKMLDVFRELNCL
jgi:hypothetical protein